MPIPKKGESKDKFMERCIPILINEGKQPNQAIAICSSMYDESKAINLEMSNEDDSGG